jgi:hypothetical protein
MLVAVLFLFVGPIWGQTFHVTKVQTVSTLNKSDAHVVYGYTAHVSFTLICVGKGCPILRAGVSYLPTFFESQLIFNPESVCVENAIYAGEALPHPRLDNGKMETSTEGLKRVIDYCHVVASNYTYFSASNYTYFSGYDIIEQQERR